MDWARAEYARIMAARREMHPELDISLEPGPKSALFARLLTGKLPLLFPPPTSFGQPWYEIVEEAGPFDILLGGTLAVTDSHAAHGDPFLEHLIINGCPWGVVAGNEPAAALSDFFQRLRHCTDRFAGEMYVNGIVACLHRRPEWVVRFAPWPDYRVYLGRAKRQAKRSDIRNLKFFRHSLDGTNLEITRVLIDGAQQAAGRAQRLAHLLEKPGHLLSHYERKALADINCLPADPSASDWVEYECDAWEIARV